MGDRASGAGRVITRIVSGVIDAPPAYLLISDVSSSTPSVAGRSTDPEL